VGLRRAGLDRAKIRLLDQAFAVIADRALLKAERVQRLRALAGDAPEVAELAQFVESSRRGLCRVRRGQPDVDQGGDP
jgi:acyl-[acyl carrier protein]--UDP-N-acetylglucosamine O-acyltransferase